VTPEQRDLTRNALRKYGERHWARTPENRRWQSAIDEGIDYISARPHAGRSAADALF